MDIEAKKLADERETCRLIKREIDNFGITQHQRLYLIYILSLELEDLESRVDLSTVSRARLEELKLLMSKEEETT